jgi:hypothetical protein
MRALLVSLAGFLLLWGAAARAQAPEPGAVVLWSSTQAPLEGLAAQWPGLAPLAGAVDVTVSVGGLAQGPRWREVQVRGDAVSWGPMPLGALWLRLRREEGAARATLQVQIEGQAAKTLRAELLVDAEINLLAGEIAWGDGPMDGEIVIEGADLGYVSSFFPVLALGGEARGALRVSGSPTAPQIDASVLGERVFWRGYEVGRWAMEWVHRGEDSALSVVWGPEAAPWGIARVRAPVGLELRQLEARWLDAGRHSLHVEANGLTPARLRPFWRAPAAADFVVDLSVLGEGSLDEFWLNGELRGELKDQDRAPLGLRASLRASPRSQRLEVGLGEGVLEGFVALEAPLVEIRRRGRRWEESALSGALAVAVPLEALGPYLPEGVDDPRGLVEGRIEAAGKLGEPALSGGLRAQGAQWTMLGLNQRWRDVALEAVVEGQRLRLEHLDGRCGEGEFKGRGALEWRMTPPDLGEMARLWSGWRAQGEASLEVSGLPVVQEGLPGGALEGALDVALSASAQEAALSLKARPSVLRLSGAGMPATRAIPRNPAVRRLDWAGRVKDTQSVFAGEGRLEVTLDLREGVHVEGEGFVMDLGGLMRVRRDGARAEVEGGFDARPGGEFALFENRFEVLRGALRMPGGDLGLRAALDPSDARYATLHDPTRPAQAAPLEPVVDFMARGFAVDTHVLVKVQGPARRPELVLLSQPPLPEYQILTLLITGRVDSVDDSNGEVRRQVEGLVSRFHNPSLSQQLYGRLGVDKLGVGFGASVAQPVVTVGKQINRQLYLETTYRHNSPPDENEKEGRVEYRLNPRWTLDTTYGDAAQGSFGLNWRARFGGPPPPQVPEAWLPEAARPEGDPDEPDEGDAEDQGER